MPTARLGKAGDREEGVSCPRFILVGARGVAEVCLSMTYNCVSLPPQMIVKAFMSRLAEKTITRQAFIKELLGGLSNKKPKHLKVQNFAKLSDYVESPSVRRVLRSGLRPQLLS
jgi:hypothetical protein